MLWVPKNSTLTDWKLIKFHVNLLSLFFFINLYPFISLTLAFLLTFKTLLPDIFVNCMAVQPLLKVNKSCYLDMIDLVSYRVRISLFPCKRHKVLKYSHRQVVWPTIMIMTIYSFTFYSNAWHFTLLSLASLSYFHNLLHFVFYVSNLFVPNKNPSPILDFSFLSDLTLFFYPDSCCHILPETL
jgi:hypothetical protein